MVILQFVIDRITKGEMMIKILMLLNLVNARSTIQHTRNRNFLGELWHYGVHILLCLGFHKIPRCEGRNDVFSALYVNFERAPEVVIYDFACQLGAYCMSREPVFFKDTCFAIDEMHAKGHSSCSQASFSSNYMQGRTLLQNVNTSAAECSNNGLNRKWKSVSYMGQRNAIALTYVYLCVWNRRRERDRQMKLVKEGEQLKMQVM